MNQNQGMQSEEFEIDLQRILKALLKKIWLVGLASVITTLLAILITFFLITPQYESSAKFYVNNSDISVGSITASITSADISAAKSLVASYIVILETRESLNDVIEYAGVDRNYVEVRNMIAAAPVNSTEIFEVVVTSPDPEEAEALANAIAYVLPKKISNIIDGTSAKVVEHAILPAEPSSPDYVKNTLLGFIIGFVLSAGAIALWEIFDLTVRTEEDVTQVCKYPILTEVPDLNTEAKGGYYAKSSKQKKSSKRGAGKGNLAGAVLFGEGLNFAASEAYKLLRTKIQFSFVDEKNSHVICTTSALTGEGKSLSAVNTAFSLAQLDKKVLLVDCDLRRPSIAKKLGITLAPGLSDYLTRNVESDEIIREYQDGISTKFDVISAGRIPPNPMELLSSERMIKITEQFREVYDYIIFDLPPIEEVGDALVAAKLADGILVVVRQDYCNRKVLENTVKQLEFVNAKILGVVLNATREDGFAGKSYYKSAYRSSYENSANAVRNEFEKRRTVETTRRVIHKTTDKEE